MKIYKYTEIFTPNDQPTVTYVVREGRSFEEDLRDHFETKNIVVSISGPSKTGKTVLLRKVLDMDSVIALSGAAITTASDFFEQIFNWIEIPVDTDTTESSGNTLGGSATGGGEVGIPLLAKGKMNASVEYGREWAIAKSKRLANNPFQKVIDEIGDSDFSIFVDDFHYIPEIVQKDLSKTIKGLAENGVKICTASVPHRSEDVVRANPELRGRLAGVDIAEWNENELKKIAIQGFEALNCKLDAALIKELSKHAFGSPQLMQILCLNLAREIGIRKTQEETTNISYSKQTFEQTLEAASAYANSNKLLQALHSGPKIKGQPRMQYDFNDGSAGDVYRGILLAIVSDPVQKEFTYDEIYNRVKSVCSKEYPTGQSISQSLTYMTAIVDKMYETNSYFEWDDELLHIIDPYLAFYLRCSNKLSELGTNKTA